MIAKGPEAGKGIAASGALNAQAAQSRGRWPFRPGPWTRHSTDKSHVPEPGLMDDDEVTAPRGLPTADHLAMVKRKYPKCNAAANMGWVGLCAHHKQQALTFTAMEASTPPFAILLNCGQVSCPLDIFFN